MNNTVRFGLHTFLQSVHSRSSRRLATDSPVACFVRTMEKRPLSQAAEPLAMPPSFPILQPFNRRIRLGRLCFRRRARFNPARHFRQHRGRWVRPIPFDN